MKVTEAWQWMKDNVQEYILPPCTSISSETFLRDSDIRVLIFSTFIINLFSLAVPVVTLQVYDRILAFQSAGTLQMLCIGVFVIVILDTALRLCRSSLIGWTSARFEHAAYMHAMRHLMHAQLQAMSASSSGELLHRLSAVARLKSFYSGQAMINLIDLPFVLIFLGLPIFPAGWWLCPSFCWHCSHAT